MKKLVLLIFLLLNLTTFSQNFESLSSGIRLNNTVYNTTGLIANQINTDSNAPFFDGINLGTFGQNSVCARITGAEIRTWKTASGNVCNSNLYWRVYSSSNSPTGVFNLIPLSVVSECNLNNNTFFDGNGLCSENNQKWKNYSVDVNFISNLIPGNYILEIYFDFTGSDVSVSTCETTKFINNSSSNFKANFTISNPTCNPSVFPQTVCNGNNISLTANASGGVAPYTYLWTGPNGFSSTLENPTLIANLLSEGVYTLIITDSCGVVSTSQNTQSVSVTPMITTEFEGLNPGLCRFGIPPLLPTLSSNGITGSWNPPIVNNTMVGIFLYTFTPDPGQCANGFTQTIFVVNNVTPFFSISTAICQNNTPFTLPTISNNGITGTWNPSVVSNTTSGTYTFTPNAGQCATNTTLNIGITPSITPTFSLINTVCYGSTAPTLPTTSNNAITGTWSPSTVSNTTSGTYTFTPNTGQCATPVTITIDVIPSTTPTFSSIDAVCYGSTAPVLPITSNNGITGTWTPAVVSNTISGIYTFTPNAGQCATSVTLNIDVIPSTTPTFSPIDAVCYGSTAPVLPSSSNNGIIGNWNPAIVSNTTSGTYTFTPNAGQCANTISITIDINSVAPIFDNINTLCYGSTAPTLPTTSNNGIAGTWTPSVVSNTSSGTYTFTPNAGQCATVVNLNIDVIPSITPTFSSIDAVCYGSTAPVLPTTSNNGIIGTWNPSVVSNTSSGTYTFTPNAGQCATSVTLNIDVIPNTTPIFSPIDAVCIGSTAPTLPTTSNNGITGTWSPAIVSNTISGTYTFTPNAGQCANAVTLNIDVIPSTSIAFNLIDSVCYGSTAPILPTTSNNGIIGNWSPAIVSNTTSGTYTFTPNAGQCATAVTINVDVIPSSIPTFSPIDALCYGSTAPTLPTTSNNGIIGTWNPSVVSNTTSGTYTFTPNAGQCANTISITIDINSVIPIFDNINTICYGSTATILPTTSNNGIIGTWTPAIVSNTTSGTYTFTPSAGQCATAVIINVDVIPNTTPIFSPINMVCIGSTAPTLPTTSNNGITGTWSPSTVSNTTSGTYTFTPNAGQCANAVTLNIDVIPSTSIAFNLIDSVCYGSTAPILPTTSNNGIIGTWTPSVVSNTISGTYTFTPNAGQCATAVTINVDVIPSSIPTFSPIDALCYGSTAPTLPTTSNNGIIGNWSPAIVSNTTSGTYTFTPNAVQCATSVIINVNVIPNTTPIFSPINMVCIGSTAPILPTTSNNGINGTWTPSVVSNTISGTYTFTPNAGQCATAVTINVDVIPSSIPTFSPIDSICYGSTSPTLPTTSNNGISGTWSPAIVSNTISGTYTFTPNAVQCATAVSINVDVILSSIPTFSPIDALCYGSTAPVLPITSNNGITGTWTPAIVSNTISGIYTFTPNTGQCANTISITIDINSVVPIFDNINTICYGSTAPTLPSTSNNGIIGTWTPSVVSNTTSGTYTFTANAGQCATPVTLNIDVIPNITQTFNPFDEVCYGSTAPTLPTTSNNGISGTWTPAIVSNTTSGTYTFTPNAGQCANTISITIDINSVVPIFDNINTLCYGSTTPTLPSTSNNGIIGTWTPAIVSNTTSGTYTFTPNAGQCATAVNLNIDVIPSITPTFSSIDAVCYGSTAPVLPTTSNNGIIGTWNPSVVSNTTSGTYTFTPNAGQCATAVNLNIDVIPSITPTFSSIDAVCYGSTAPLLPTTSNNGIIGTWNPSVVSNTTSGTYTFTPNAGQCATAVIINVDVIPNTTPTFSSIDSFCYGSTAPILPTTSNNGIIGTWTPTIVSNTTSGTYIFTPYAGQCATSTLVNIDVNTSPSDIDISILNDINESSQGSIIINEVISGTAPYTYSLNGGSFSNTTTYLGLSSGEYTIRVRDSNGCEYEETITISSDCLFPKGISPNGDNINDTFNLKGCNVISLEIFNRYGIKVNSFGEYTNQWDGTTSKGELLPDGTYYYFAQTDNGTKRTGWVYINH